MTQQETKKHLYILDTNVLLHDPNALFSFEGGNVALPLTVLEELDRFKRATDDLGRNAREVIRHLDALRSQGSLLTGVALQHGGTLRVLETTGAKHLPASLDPAAPDNKILLDVLDAQAAGERVVLVTKDINARVKADVLGIPAQDYLKGIVTYEEFYRGWVKVDTPVVDLKREFPLVLNDLVKEKQLAINEFVHVESNHNAYNYRLFRYLGGDKFKHVVHPNLRWPLKARNPQQLMAIDLLADPAIELVTLFGPAGTGKTFLALLMGLHAVLVKDEYKKMLISRPVVPLGKDIGYLPGDLQEKLHGWMQPIYDNMELIMHEASIGMQVEQIYDEDNFMQQGRHRGKRHARNGEIPQRRGDLGSIESLVKRGKLSLDAITYMRGRSIPYQFVLIDEVQNLTPHEVKTIVSRVGQGSKIVLCGDPYQIDSPFLDFTSNGLIVATNRFKGQSLFGAVFLENSERSTLSKLAGELL